MEARRFNVFLKSAKELRRLVANAPKEQVPEIQDFFRREFDLPLDIIQAATTRPDFDDLLSTTEEHSEQFRRFCGNSDNPVECIVNLRSNKTFMEGLERDADARNFPVVGEKLAAMQQIINSRSPGFIDDATNEQGQIDISLAELQRLNVQIGRSNPRAALTPSEFGTFRRNRAEFGFADPELKGIAAKAAAGRQTPEEAGAVAGAKERATLAARQDFGQLDKTKGKAVNLLLPDGKRATGRELPDGTLQVLGAGGLYGAAPPGALKLAVQATPGQLPDAASRRRAVELETGARNFARLASETVKLIRSNNFVPGRPGRALVFFQGVGAVARTMIQAFGPDQNFDGNTGQSLSAAEILDPNRYDFSGLKAIAGASSRVRSNSVAMAYVLARLRDPSGRLSDFDVQAALQSLGFESLDKDIIEATISDRMREVHENAANFIEIATGKRPQFADIQARAARQQATPRKSLSQQDLEAIIRGQ